MKVDSLKTTWLTEAKFHVAPPWDRGTDGKLNSNDSGHLLLLIIVNTRGGGWGPSAGISSQIRPAGQGLENCKMLKALLFSGPEGGRAGDTNDWCIYKHSCIGIICIMGVSFEMRGYKMENE